MTRALALCCLMSSGCALFSNSGASAKLQKGFTVASQRAALAEARVEELEARLQRVEERVAAGSVDGAAGQDEDLVREVSALRAAIEELTFSGAGMRADFDAYTLDQEQRQLYDETRLTQLEQLLAVNAPSRPSLGGEPVPEATPTSDQAPADAADVAEPTDVTPNPSKEPAPNDATSAQLALVEERMAGGQQAAARVILERLLDSEPEEARLPEIRYRLAETLYNEGKFREAARSFQIVTDKHASSPWAPWAMFRIGECFVGMGREDAAEAFFDGVIRNFPGTDAAREAAGRLGR